MYHDGSSNNYYVYKSSILELTWSLERWLFNWVSTNFAQIVHIGTPL